MDTSSFGSSADGLLATQSSLSSPAGVAVAGNGDVFIADAGFHRVRLVIAASGLVFTIAGTGDPGYNGDNINGTLAELNGPLCVALSSNGTTLFIADTLNHRVRELVWSSDPRAGVLLTVAGTGAAGYNSDGLQATAAWLSSPSGLAVAQNGDMFIADRANQRIRLVSQNGIISTVAGTGSSGWNGDGISATSAKLWDPTGVALSAGGGLYIADSANNIIRLVAAGSGLISTVAGTHGSSIGFFGDGGPATLAVLAYPTAVAVSPTTGNVIIADTLSNRVRVVSAATSVISTLVGTVVGGYDSANPGGGELNQPRCVTLDSSGSVLYICDALNNLVRKAAAQPVTPAAPSTSRTPSPTPYCAPALYRALPRTDLVGMLTGNAWYPGVALPSASEAACRQACCDAPVCDAYSFAANDLLQFTFSSPTLPPVASCFLYTNVTALVPSSGYASGALLSVYS